MNKKINRFVSAILACLLMLTMALVPAAADTSSNVDEVNRYLSSLPEISSITSCDKDTFETFMKKHTLYDALMDQSGVINPEKFEQYGEVYIELFLTAAINSCQSSPLALENWKEKYVLYLDIFEAETMAEYFGIVIDSELDEKAGAAVGDFLAFLQNNATDKEFVSDYFNYSVQHMLDITGTPSADNFKNAYYVYYTSIPALFDLVEVVRETWPDVSIDAAQISRYQENLAVLDTVIQEQRPSIEADIVDAISYVSDVTEITEENFAEMSRRRQIIENLLEQYAMFYEDAFDEEGNPDESKITNYEDYLNLIANIFQYIWETNVPGDVDGDGKVGTNDALIVLQCAVGKIEMTDELYVLGDVNGDSQVGTADALLVLQKAVGKIDKFPVE